VADEAVRASRALEGDQLDPAQLCHAERSALYGFASAARDDQHVFVERERLALQYVLVLTGKVDEARVQVAAFERLNERRFVGAIVEDDFDLRRGTAELAHDVGEEERSDRLVGPDAQLDRAFGAELGLGGGEARLDSRAHARAGARPRR
jgi:hypothetical protein